MSRHSSETPKFCNFCNEMVYSPRCPYCERKATPMRFDAEQDEAEVSSGGRWGAEDMSSPSMISYDELFTDDE